jgi:hypothetical protein
MCHQALFNVQTQAFERQGALMASENVKMNRPVADAGLAVINAGGEFSDCLIALEGYRIWGEIFFHSTIKLCR